MAADHDKDAVVALTRHYVPRSGLSANADHDMERHTKDAAIPFEASVEQVCHCFYNVIL
jgi:hypothetical protein